MLLMQWFLPLLNRFSSLLRIQREDKLASLLFVISYTNTYLIGILAMDICFSLVTLVCVFSIGVQERYGLRTDRP